MAGVRRQRGCGQVFYHSQRALAAAIHGDDIISSGGDYHLEFLDKKLRGRFRVKVSVVIGPGYEEKALFFLNREIRYHANQGYSWHPNPRHIDEVAEELILLRQPRPRNLASGKVKLCHKNLFDQSQVKGVKLKQNKDLSKL